MQMLSTFLPNSLTDREVVELVLDGGLNMAMFRLPGQAHASLYICRETRSVSPGGIASGFLFAPFNNKEIRVVTPEYVRALDIPVPKPRAFRAAEAAPMPEDYGRRIGTLVNRLAERGGKTVFAVRRELTADLDIYDTFMSLANAYPEAFVFCWKTAESPEVWAGATPEILAACKDGEFVTMALAGTRRADSDDTPWDLKNREEQRMVCDFILDVCSKAGLDPLCEPTYTHKAGPVEHICNLIKVRMPEDADPLRLACELAPTPAVSGFPRHAALADIAELEGFPREYYAGWCGVASEGECDLYVTLRCMSIYPKLHSCRLYAGGGITARSYAPDEWAEVNAKMQTLFNAIDY